MTAIELKRYIFDNHKVENVLQEIGCGHIKYHNAKEYWSCSNYDGDNQNAVNIFNNEYLGYVNYTRGVSADMHQDIISLVEHNKKIDFVSALKWLHKLFNIPYTYHFVTPSEPEKPDPLHIFKKYLCKRKKCDVTSFTPVDESVLFDFVPIGHINWFREGILNRSIKKFGIMYSYDWHRIIVPVRYFATGELMGYTGRTTVDNFEELGISKYWITPNMPKTISLYGLWENRRKIEQAGYVVVFEAEKSVLKRDSHLDETCVALEGHTLSEEQVRILMSLKVNEIIFALDNDVSETEIHKLCKQLYRVKKVSYIKDKWGLLGEKDSPADLSDKGYNFLLKHRITYRG
jgi:DNA primase